MSSLKVRVEDYTGSLGDDTALEDWINAGAKLIVDALPEHVLNEYATTKTVTTSGLNIYPYRIWKVLKNGYGVPIVDVGLRTAIQDSNSLHYAISTSPAAVIYGGKIYIYPDGGEILAMAYPNSIQVSDSTISNFPSRMLQGVVLYAAVQGFLRKASNALISINSLTVPTAPNAPSISFTSITGETITAATSPTYTKPTSSMSDTDLSTYIATEEDLTKADTEIGHQKTLLEQHQMDLYNELNEFNGELEVFKTNQAKFIEQARLSQEANIINSTKELEAAIADYQSQVNKYQAEVQSYVSQSNSIINEIQGYYEMITRTKAELNDFIQTIVRSNG